MDEKVRDLADSKYISLETFRRNGDGVKTPVWFVTANDRIYVVTGASTGKVRRLAKNPKVRLAPCTFRGSIEGDWLFGMAKTVPKEDVKMIMNLRRKKYGIKTLLSRLAAKTKGGQAVYSIKLD